MTRLSLKATDSLLMTNIAALWRQYHDLMRQNKAAEARLVMRQIQGFKGNPPPKTGCGSCSRRLS